MKYGILILLVLILTLVFGISSNMINHHSYSFSFGWSPQSISCPTNNATCLSQNVCISPVNSQVLGFPFTYQKADMTSCRTITNIFAEVINWLIGFFISFILVFGVALFIKHKKEPYL